jgi:5,10-methylenetetrahydromethanopterin reductase
MKFSYCTIPNRPIQEIVEIAIESERNGVDLMWIPDEEFYRDPFSLLSAIGSKISRMQLGLGITNPYTRHPAQVARAMATIQDLCAQPLVIGIGAGLKRTRDALASPEGKFVEVTRDAVIAMKALLSGESVSMENNVFQMKNAKLNFIPKIMPKIFVASTHPDAFRMAGEVADGAIVGNVAQPEAFQSVVGFLEEGIRAAGRSRADFTTVAWNMALWGDDPGQLADIIRNMIARTITASHSQIRSLQKLDPTMVETIVARVKGNQFPIERELVPDDVIRQLAFIGSAQSCVDGIRALSAAGADMVGIRPAGDIQKSLDYEAHVLALHRKFSAS